MFDHLDEMFDRADKHREKLEDVMSKLRTDPCMEIPSVGDCVVIAAGPLGMGHNWIRLEAEVLHVANNSYKIIMRDRYGKDKHYEGWIDPVLVLDIVKKERMDE
jgi:hypothetical protein